jgi:hypothetical protein
MRGGKAVKKVSRKRGTQPRGEERNVEETGAR